MASGSDASPSRHREKRSKHNQDLTESSWLTGRTKASCPRDAASVHGRGCGARAHGAQAQDPPPLVGATAREFIPGLGDVPICDPTEEALDQEGRTIADDVCTLTPPSGPGYFGIS